MVERELARPPRQVVTAPPAVASTAVARADAPVTRTGDGGFVDPVLEALDVAGTRYVGVREEYERTKIELADAKLRAEQLAAELRRACDMMAQQRERADRLGRAMKDIHASLFRGGIYGLILNTCLTLTGATRGLYITARGSRSGPQSRLRIRAAVDVDGYPDSPPSAFLQTLCERVSERQDSLVFNSPEDWATVPPPERPSEQFRNCVVTPVVLLKNFDGIILAADKLDGNFHEDDIETLLSVGDHSAVAVQNRSLQQALQSAYLSTVSMLADVVEAKDPYTSGHCEEVSRYARLIAERLDLREYDRQVVCYAALLHDVGKIGVSDGVLNKPGALLPEERELMRAHVRIGHDLISRVPALSSVADVVLHHHEWFDGSGYPDGLRGEAIPVAARIVAVVDAYCAMMSKRSYKEAYTPEHARDELRRYAGTQFDPRVVEALIAVLDTPEAQDGDLDHDAECGLLPGFDRLLSEWRGAHLPSGAEPVAAGLPEA